MTRVLLLLTVVLTLGACHKQPHYRNVEDMPQDWSVPNEDREYVVSAPMVYTELQDYTENLKNAGWYIHETEPAGKLLPGKYIVTASRAK